MTDIDSNTGIAEKIAKIRAELREAACRGGHDPDGVRLLAASKTQSVDRIREAVVAGVDAIGENRVQEMLAKEGAYEGTELHFIGRLQKNKVKNVVGRVALIHSVDDGDLASLVAGQARELHIVQDILLQVNIAGEATKGGIDPGDIRETFSKIQDMSGIRVRGLMCIPPPLHDPLTAEGGKIFFSKMRELYVDISHGIYDNRDNHAKNGFSILSMGMSGDYIHAAEHGSTLVRVGSAVFGART